MIKQILVVVVSWLLFACGGGGTSPHIPVISNLQTTAQSAFLNDGNGTLQIGAQVDFSDSGGDINGFTLEIYNSQNDLLQSLTGSILGASGLTTGTGGASLSINTTMVDVYRFELSFSDASGNQSNIITGFFPVLGPKRITSNMPDTGVNRCFNQNSIIDCPGEGTPYHGQDFMYSSNEMSFTDHKDGTVADNVTALVWQQTNDNTYNWYQASGTFHATHNAALIDACGDLALAGRADWRLPTSRELMTIVDYSIDINVIASSDLVLAGPDYWAIEDNVNSARYLNFVNGSITLANKLTNMNVRCVSGQRWGINSFMNNGDGTVSDMTSGLMWQQTGQSSGLDWQEMLAACENLNLAGYSDWRLADIKELETIKGAESELSTNRGIYCSSSNVAFEHDSVWIIQFEQTSNYGDVFSHGAGNSKQLCSSFYSRCVR